MNDSSDNLTSADNQQERLIKIGWITGFVDGEGCFSIGFVKQFGNSSRKGYTTGYQVWYEFAVTQGEKSLSSLEELQKFFGVGNIYINKRHDNHKENLYRYVVRKRVDLEKVIVPFFTTHPLRTAKNDDFKKFAQCLSMISTRFHLTDEGLVEIAKIAQTMNRRKPRDYLIRIPRDYTPNAVVKDSEDIVPSA